MKLFRESSRRSFIKQTALISTGFLALSRCTLKDKQVVGPSGIELIPDPKKYIDLPQGFHYKVISRAGEKMDDGFLVPGRADGMGAFAGKEGRVIVIRNHENSPGSSVDSPFGENNELWKNIDPLKLYDAGRSKEPSLGGTTTFIYNEKTGQVERQYLSLAGTNRNCAGGITPWNSWLTCEEDVSKQNETAEKDHGYVFEVPATDEIGLVDPVPLTAMGRFNHEAVAVDPKTSIVYQTEDAGDGLFYRFIPNVAEQLSAGGQLQILVVIDQPQFDTRNWDAQKIKLNEPVSVRWMDIDDVLSPENDLRERGFKLGAARFARGEGIWFGKDELFFACTNGGPSRSGQVFRYKTSPHEGTSNESQQAGTLELYAESPDKTILNKCDNLTIAPWGDVILCEDNGQLNHIRGINKNGELYNFGVNRGSGSEFAGLVFSPSGKTLFVNIQESGETVAITGPWESFS